MKDLTDLTELLNEILEVKLGTDEKYIVAQGIGRKLMLHSNSINILLENSIDISSCITLTRTALETYAVFNLLYLNGTEEEKQLRFDLWKIDALKTRQKYSVSVEVFDPQERKQMVEQLEDEEKQIAELKDKIRSSNYYKNFPNGYNNLMIKNAVWKFNIEKIAGYNKTTKIDMGIKTMVEKCGIKEIYLQDIYSFTSMHAHTNFISIMQGKQMDRENFEISKRHLGILNSILITYFINSFIKLYDLSIKNYCEKNHIFYTFERRIMGNNI
ncbi:MAG: DUF5677 domain-containing protein [Salinivirgaceae bacterium]|nr:DUF5677 domain-containing protein [Salinivirgaceae bacterium]MDD4747382.1 DUF5677 domain-containing protein [Salinivirgaceae bacterium]